MSDRAWGWLRVMWANPLLIVGVLVLGAGSSFVYSYVPLHASKTWKIGYLEQRVDQQNTVIQDLEERLRSSAAEASERPERGEFDALRAELEQAQQELVSQRALEKRSKRTIRSLRRSRDQWKAKHDELLPRLEIAEAAVAAQFPPASEDEAGLRTGAELAVEDGPQEIEGPVVLAPSGEPASAPSAASGSGSPEPAPAAPSD